MKQLLLSLAIMYAIYLPASCQSKNDNPRNYDLNHPQVLTLPDDLDEISDLAYNAEDKTIYAIHDDNGFLYSIQLTPTLTITKQDFHKSRDFEGVALYNNKVFALNSNGNIKAFSYINNKVSDLQDLKFPYKGKNEFESLYFDKVRKKLTIICKNCSKDKKDEVSAFVLDPQSYQYDKAAFSINAAQIADKLGEKSISFRPSAAEIHPLTGDLYIVSSINKLLVVADPNGKVKAVYKLDADIFKQPEGLTFLPNGDMLISNEAAGKGNANILRFNYHK